MRAMLLRAPSPTADGTSSLAAAEVRVPEPGRGEILVRVSVCGVCRTDLDLVEGRLTAPRYPVIPGHQVVGRVERAGDDVVDFRVGDRVGVAWINSACGRCAWCLSGRENLCPSFRSTGCDENGGYAEYVVVPAAFAHAIPAELPDASAAPLLCAGAIGWRSLRLTELVGWPGPRPHGLRRVRASRAAARATSLSRVARLRLRAQPTRARVRTRAGCRVGW